MAKVDGPLYSLAAHGTYRGELVFRTDKNGTHVSQPPTVTAGRSLGQQQHNANVAALAAAWKALPQATRDSWRTCAVTFGTNGYRLWWREWVAQGASAESPPALPCP